MVVVLRLNHDPRLRTAQDVRSRTCVPRCAARLCGPRWSDALRPLRRPPLLPLPGQKRLGTWDRRPNVLLRTRICAIPTASAEVPSGLKITHRSHPLLAWISDYHRVALFDAKAALAVRSLASRRSFARSVALLQAKHEGTLPEVILTALLGFPPGGEAVGLLAPPAVAPTGIQLSFRACRPSGQLVVLSAFNKTAYMPTVSYALAPEGRGAVILLFPPPCTGVLGGCARYDAVLRRCFVFRRSNKGRRVAGRGKSKGDLGRWN